MARPLKRRHRSTHRRRLPKKAGGRTRKSSSKAPRARGVTVAVTSSPPPQPSSTPRDDTPRAEAPSREELRAGRTELLVQGTNELTGRPIRVYIAPTGRLTFVETVNG